MKKACLVVSKAYRSNKIFKRENKILNRDDCLAPFVFLREEFRRHGYDLSTNDINQIDDSDIVVYNDMPETLPNKRDYNKSFLIVLESPIIVKNSWERGRLNRFKKVFTWNDDYIDEKKFFKVNYSFDFSQQGFLKEKKSKLLCLISANKMSDESNELYSERIKTIRFFESISSDVFDLYGMGWDKVRLSGPFKILRRVPLLWKMIPYKKYSSYRGTVESKKQIMSKYNFAICYENISNVNGYITEKIFDCFFAGTVPIYYGANNIEEYIPSSCFIDRRKFLNNADLYDFIKNISVDDYNKYINNIEIFLHNEKDKSFSCEYFSKKIVSKVLEAL